MQKVRKVLSLFSGCGGMDLGFEGGFKVKRASVNEKIHPAWMVKEEGEWVTLPKTCYSVVFANDILRSAKAAWEPYFNAVGSGIFHLESIVDLVKKSRSGEFIFPEADIVTGGFPCQDFSVAGKRRGFKSHKSHLGGSIDHVEDPSVENRGMLYIWMKNVIEIVKPKVFIAENVKGLVSISDTKKIIENDFRNVGDGYFVADAKVLHAADYGVPQTRERIFFIGVRKDLLTENVLKKLSSGEIDLYPPITHGMVDGDGSLLREYVTAGECIKDLPEPEVASDLAQQKYSQAKWYGNHCQGQSEINLNSLAPTIRAEHHGNIEFRRLSLEHGGQYIDELNRGLIERRLTVRECARLQTFPDDYEFIRPQNSHLGKDYRISASEAYKLIGNAVPPLLAYHIAWHLQSLWDVLFEGE